MPSLADVVREHGAAYVRRYGGAMPARHARALDAITQCRTAALGAELGVCGRCGASHVLYHSCRNRACPRCGYDATRRWTERQRRGLLPLPYFHVVFTLPAELRRLVRDHQRTLLDVLFRAAFESLSILAADPRHLGARIGALSVLHTWTRTLQWHPHVHLLVPGGGLAPDGRTFVGARRPNRADFLVPVRALGKHFRGRFLHLARRTLPGVQFPPIPWNKPWVVYAKRSLEERPERLLDYLARYVHRTALTDKRIASSDAESVSFTYQPSAGGRRKVMTLGGDEFLRRFLQHVPLPGFHRVRAYGLLHPRNRHLIQRLQLLLATRPAEPVPKTAPEAATNEETPGLRTHVVCPTCKAGMVSIIRRLSAAELAARPAVDVAPRSRAPP